MPLPNPLSVALLATLLFALLPCIDADRLSFNNHAYSEKRKYSSYPHQVYGSIDAAGPLLQVNTWNKSFVSQHESHIFFRNSADPTVGNGATPVILDADSLDTVYIDRSYPKVFGTRVQQDRGRDYLTFFGGPILGIGLGNGTSHMLDQSYREAYEVRAQNLSTGSDVHEFELVGNGTAIVTAYDLVETELTSFENPKVKVVRDSIFQEIDLDTEELLFEWRASAHVRLEDTFVGVGENVDFFHINSVEKASRSGPSS